MKNKKSLILIFSLLLMNIYIITFLPVNVNASEEHSAYFYDYDSLIYLNEGSTYNNTELQLNIEPYFNQTLIMEAFDLDSFDVFNVSLEYTSLTWVISSGLRTEYVNSTLDILKYGYVVYSNNTLMTWDTIFDDKEGSVYINDISDYLQDVGYDKFLHLNITLTSSGSEYYAISLKIVSKWNFSLGQVTFDSALAKIMEIVPIVCIVFVVPLYLKSDLGKYGFLISMLGMSVIAGITGIISITSMILIIIIELLVIILTVKKDGKFEK